MCRYSYSNGKCANIDVEVNFCVGEKNCNITDILQIRSDKESSINVAWQPLPSKIWEIGKYLDINGNEKGEDNNGL